MLNILYAIYLPYIHVIFCFVLFHFILFYSFLAVCLENPLDDKGQLEVGLGPGLG